MITYGQALEKLKQDTLSDRDKSEIYMFILYMGKRMTELKQELAKTSKVISDQAWSDTRWGY